jgi:protein SCO1/2
VTSRPRKPGLATASAWLSLAAVVSISSLLLSRAQATESILASTAEQPNAKTFAARGEIRDLEPDGRTIVIRHDAISNYMDAMTMPFHVKDTGELAGLRVGDAISFRLHVTETESWIDSIKRDASVANTGDGKNLPAVIPPASVASATKPRHPLLDYHFTNELGQAMSLGEFHGQALAITFFFTRCPIPDYCPRLSKNFQEASQKLLAMPNAPTNWHFLSISFDSEYDQPSVLKAYAQGYHYDPKHWSFLTGPADKIGELARQSNLNFERDGGLFNHDFRTLIVDANGRLQMVFPVGGNLSDAIVDEVIKAATVTNTAAAQDQK